MTNKIEYIIFKAFSYIFKFCGLRLSRKFSSILAFVFFYFIPIRKKTTIDNLAKAFPEYSTKQINKIAYGCYKSFAISLIEILYSPWMTKEQIEKAITCSNVDFIMEKYKENNGLLLLSAHFGNWEYMALSIGAQLKLPLHVVVKPQRNPFVTNWLDVMRTKWGNKIITLGVSIRQVYKELKEKNIIAMVADQRGPSDGMRVNFFGRKATIYPGPAVLALKTHAPILYGIPVRQPDFSYKTDFYEISSADLPEDEEQKIIELNQRMFNYLESFIRKNPEQWLWMHKRWKY
jgi:Kdo2-lipid IVA lauroyltransferase/acyltransferase